MTTSQPPPPTTRNVTNEIIHLTNMIQNTPTQILATQFKSVINQINPIEAQNQEIYNRIVNLTSILLEHIVTVDRTGNQIPSALATVILVFEEFVDSRIRFLLNNDSFETENVIIGSVQVVIQRIDLSNQLNDVMIPEQTPIQETSPAAHIPVSVIKQFAKENNASSLYILAIVFNLSVVIEQAQTTQFLSLSFHLPADILTGTENMTFSQNINFTFPYTIDNSLVSQPECFFLNSSQRIETAGVELVGVNEQFITCATNHLTSFAAIIRFGRETNRNEFLASKIVSFLLLSCSFLALSISLLIFCLIGKPFFRSLPNLIYFNYAVALTLACGVFIFLLPTGVLNAHYCIVSSLFAQYIWIAVFSWSACISIVLIQFFKEKRIFEELRYFILYFLLGWGLPFIPVSITFFFTIPNGVINDYILYEPLLDNQTCFLSNSSPSHAVWGMLVPILILLILNSLALLYLTVKLCWKLTPNTKLSVTFYDQYKLMYIQFLVLISILGLPWFFLVINSLTSYFSQNENLKIIFEWIFIIINSPIGVVFFFAYTIKNPQVKNLFSGDPKFTIFTSQSAVTHFSPVEECKTLPASLPKPRKPPVKANEFTSLV